MITENMGLVYMVAKRFANRGTDLQDLTQIGVIGLIKAIDRFDTSLSYSFSTYAVPLIMGEIRRFLRDDGMIHTSRQMKEHARKIAIVREQMKKTQNKEPTLQELAEKTGIAIEDLVVAMEAGREVDSFSRPVTENDGKVLTLEEKLEDMKKLHEDMKAANKALRLKDKEAGNDQLREMGYSEESIEELRKPDYLGRVGYPNFQLSNNNANIHRVEERLKRLKAVKERGSSEQEYKTFKVVENTEAMRYQIIFDGKPDAEIRTLLKSNGFKWAPSQGAWQRQITSNGKWALKKVVEKLKEMEA